MQSADFYSIFEIYKERYLQQEQLPGSRNKNALDQFEEWLRGNENLPRIKVKDAGSKKIDLGKFLTDVASEAKKVLAGRDVTISCITLGLKESSKCISAFRDNTIYYRIGKTSPRKGQYRGMELLAMELIMDGNKNNVFIPLLDRVEDLEKRLRAKIHRESPKVEATGKYRFKLLFVFEDVEVQEMVRKYGRILSEFIFLTRQELLELNVV